MRTIATKVMAMAMVGAALLGGASDAEAKCRAPRPFANLPADARVPANATVWIFAPDAGWTLADAALRDADGAERTLETDTRPDNGPISAAWVRGFDVLPGPYTLVVSLSGPNGATQRLAEAIEIGPATPTPRPERATLPSPAPMVSVGAVRSRVWSCSREHARELRVDAGPGAVIVLHVADHADGRGERVLVFPRDTARFFGASSDSPPWPGEPLLLGFVNCMGPSFDWTHRRAVYVRAQTLALDGAESSLSPQIRVPAP